MSTPTIPDEVFALRAQGLKLRDIAQRTGLSLACVSARLNLKVGRPRQSPKGKERKCLCCGKVFMSAGPHNRMCNGCRRYSAGPFDTPHAVNPQR